MTERLPPHNFEAEMALLAAILINNKAYVRVAPFLRDYHFADPDHRLIYATIEAMINRGAVANPVTVRSELDPDQFQKHERDRYMAQLAANAVSIIGADDYANAIYDAWARRELITVSDAAKEMVYESPDIRAAEIIAGLESDLAGIPIDRGYDRQTIGFDVAVARTIEIARAAREQDRSVIGLSTGIEKFDRLVGGLRRKNLIVIAGRPSMGKTTLALNVARNVASQGHRVLLFTLEQSADEATITILASISGVPANRVYTGQLSDDDMAALSTAAQTLERIPLDINDSADTHVDELRAVARRHDAELIMVDYLQLLAGTTRGQKHFNDTQRVTGITRGLKVMAGALDMPVVALSQLSRGVESREDKRPVLSDLRDSGSIEQDADLVIFVFREEYYLLRSRPGPDADIAEEADWRKRLEDVKNKCEVIVGKRRHGPIGRLTLSYDSVHSRFYDPAEDEIPFDG